MEALRADITEFLVGLVSAFLRFFEGEDSELTEEQVAGIKGFVDIIFGL